MGSGLHAKYLMQTYSFLFNAIDYEHEKIPVINRIWLLHKPAFYKYSFVLRKDDVNCVRAECSNQVPGIKATNGYSYFKRHLYCFDQWFPTIYDSHFKVNDIPSIGYYARDMRRQSNKAFIDFIEKIPDEIPIVTMGTKELVERYLCHRKNWKHIYSNDDFWRSCSHYFYYQPSDFEDPFPHTLLEAIQSQHRIISIKDVRRTHVDGVNDLLSCIEYDDRFIPENKGKFYDILTSTMWKQYMQNIVESKFMLKPNVLSYGFLYDWMCKEFR